MSNISESLRLKKLDLTSLLDDIHVEGYAFVIFMIGFQHSIMWLIFILYVFLVKRVIRYHVLLVLLCLGFVIMLQFKKHDIPKHIYGIATIVDIEKMTYSNRLTLSFEQQKYHVFSTEDIKLGDRYVIKADVESYRKQTVPKGFDAHRFFYSKGIDGKLHLHEWTFIQSTFHIFEYRMKLLDQVSQLKSQSIVLSMVFGETNFDEESTDRYRSLGILYLFSMSGLHVYVMMEGLKKVMFHLDLSVRIQTLIIILFLLCTLYLYQGSYVILRILLMFVFYKISQTYQLGSTGLDRIQWAFLLMILMNHRLLMHQGFFITYIILNMIHLSDYLYKSLDAYSNKVTLTGIVQLVIMPFTRLFSPMLLPFFPLIQFVMSYVVTPLSFLVLFFPFLDSHLSRLMVLLDSSFIFLSEKSINLSLPSLSILSTFIYLLMIISLLKSKSWIGVTWKSLMIILLFWIPSLKLVQDNQVVFIDVGQGEAIYIDANDCRMLIDAYRGSYDYLKNHGIRKLDILVLTHSDSDHTHDATEIINHMKIKRIFISAYDHYDAFRHDQIFKVKSGDKFNCGELWIDILGPIRDYQNSNDNSIVLQLEAISKIFLFVGDIEESAEIDLVNTYGNHLKSDVLKVGHHGSMTSSTEYFIEKVMPEYAVISLGYNNRFNFPDPQVISRLMKHDVSIFRTDIHGTVIYHLCEKKPKWKIHLPYQH